MAKTVPFVPCPGCGLTRTLRFFGLDEHGKFDGQPRQELELRLHTYSGRARITVAREPMPLHFALGLRDMLKARLAQLEQELADAGVVLES